MMRNRNYVILLLCISIILSGCNSVEKSSNSSTSSSTPADTTTSIDVTETSTDSSSATTEAETETSITYESYAIPEVLSREEIYEDVGYTLLTAWSQIYYIDSDRHIYLREYSDFNETMMLEFLYTAFLLYIPPTLSGRPQIFDNCHRSEGQNSLDYTIQAMHFLFDCEISREQIKGYFCSKN